MSRHNGSKQPTKAYQRASLAALLIFRENLDALSPESLARTHGLSLAEVNLTIEAERERRRAG